MDLSFFFLLPSFYPITYPAKILLAWYLLYDTKKGTISHVLNLGCVKGFIPALFKKVAEKCLTKSGKKKMHERNFTSDLVRHVSQRHTLVLQPVGHRKYT